MNTAVFLQLLVALAVGLVIGIERGWSRRDEAEGRRVAGIRTFGIAGLAGGLCFILVADGPLLLAAFFIGLSALIATAYFVATARSADYGITTALALLTTVLLGALATRYPLESIATATLIAVLLGLKKELHHTLVRLDREEFLATLQLLLVAAVALPLLPDQNIGPWQSVNPRIVGWLVLLILGLSYAGYFAVRILGARTGLLLTAFLGGLTSSTAVTLTYARMARANTLQAPLLGAGIALAAATMAPRVMLEIAVVQPRLLPLLWLPFAILGGAPLAFAFLIARREKPATSGAELRIKNPLALEMALVLGLGLTLLTVAVHGARVWIGDAGAYLVAALSGLVDVDAIAVSLAQAAGSEVPMPVAAHGILLAALLNTLVKSILALVVGGWHLARWCSPVLFLSAAAAAGILVI
jgi:uncharacterized membrane protein (DUF4010 family)